MKNLFADICFSWHVLCVNSVQLAIVSACDGYAREQARSTSSKKARDPVVSALVGRFVEAADGVSAFVTGPFVC